MKALLRSVVHISWAIVWLAVAATTAQGQTRPGATSPKRPAAPPQVDPFGDYPSGTARRPGKVGAGVETSPARPIDPGPFTQPVGGARPIEAAQPQTTVPPQQYVEPTRYIAPATEAAQATMRSNDTGTGRPGPKQLDGPQSPTLAIEKRAPAEVQVGKPAKTEIVVRNVGQSTAYDVVVRDDVPQGARLLQAQPQPEPGTDGEMIWSLGSLRAGQTASVVVEWLPLAEGEIGSVATVQFSGVASARSRVTHPELTLEAAAPAEALLGDTIAVKIKLTNVGSGAATGVVIVDHLPAHFEHPAGAALEQEIGTLGPGETRTLDLTMRARQPGTAANVLTAHADGGLQASQQTTTQILAPQLQVALDGSRRRILERQATYTLTIANPGTAPARKVELVAYLPPSIEFNEANHQGRYHQATRTVHWLLEELPAGQQGDVTLSFVPHEAGTIPLRLQAQAERGLTTERQETIQVEGVATLGFEVVDQADPIELGGETVYAIRVANQGTKDALAVQVVAILPSTMQLMSVEGPTRYEASEGVRFEPLARLAPKAEAIYRLRVRGNAAGDQRLRVQLTSDEIRTPITKEESTRVLGE